MKLLKTININNIKINTYYGIVEFYKNNVPYFRLSKYKNTKQYSILDYKKGVMTFFVGDWNRKKLIKHYVNLLTNI